MPIFTLIERINMHKNRPWLRFIEGPNGNTGAAPAAPEPAGQSDAGEQSPPDTAPSTDEGQGDGENPDARGSKQAVLADLARERDKRQSLESERDELKAKVEAFERAQMSEAEKVEADRKDLEQKYTDAQAKIAEHERKTSLAEIVSEFKIPAAMADRIQGETPEQMRADAQALAQALGPYTGPSDPSAGQGGGKQPPAQSLDAGIAAFYAR